MGYGRRGDTVTRRRGDAVAWGWVDFGTGEETVIADQLGSFVRLSKIRGADC
jgi:hypothetical protein